MKIESNDPIAEYSESGQELRVTFDHATHERANLDGSKQKVYTANAVVVPLGSSSAAIIEAIIATKYSTGAELGLSRAPDTDPEKQAYLTHVSTAKKIAKGRANLDLANRK